MQPTTDMHRADTDTEPRPKLTDRQVQVIELLIAGNSVKQIAVKLAISPRTVKKHLLFARFSLGAATRGEMIARAMTFGLVALR